jgi:hypothetical protein
MDPFTSKAQIRPSPHYIRVHILFDQDNEPHMSTTKFLTFATHSNTWHIDHLILPIYLLIKKDREPKLLLE